MKTLVSITFSLLFAISANAQANKLNVIVDERMELLTTIQYLADYPILTPADIRYKKDIDQYFKDHKQHNAVLLYKQVYRRFFNFDGPPTYIYHFSFPELKQVAVLSPADIATYGFDVHRDTLDMLFNEFRDFYAKTNFHKFYTSHRSFYDSLTAPVKARLVQTDVIRLMEDHYGQQNKAYTVVLVPLLNDGGYGIPVQTKEGKKLYAVIGPKYDSKDIPEFDIENLLSYYVIHEFSHPFCNPLVEQHMSELIRDSCLLAPIKDALEEQGYGNWKACLFEHIVRANEIILNERLFGTEKANQLMSEMISKDKWIYLEGLVPIIRQYIANRSKYKTEADIMPLVIAYFNQQAETCK